MPLPEKELGGYIGFFCNVRLPGVMLSGVLTKESKDVYSCKIQSGEVVRFAPGDIMAIGRPYAP